MEHKLKWNELLPGEVYKFCEQYSTDMRSLSKFVCDYRVMERILINGSFINDIKNYENYCYEVFKPTDCELEFYKHCKLQYDSGNTNFKLDFEDFEKTYNSKQKSTTPAKETSGTTLASIPQSKFTEDRFETYSYNILSLKVGNEHKTVHVQILPSTNGKIIKGYFLEYPYNTVNILLLKAISENTIKGRSILDGIYNTLQVDIVNQIGKHPGANNIKKLLDQYLKLKKELIIGKEYWSSHGTRFTFNGQLYFKEHSDEFRIYTKDYPNASAIPAFYSLKFDGSELFYSTTSPFEKNNNAVIPVNPELLPLPTSVTPKSNLIYLKTKEVKIFNYKLKNK